MRRGSGWSPSPSQALDPNDIRALPEVEVLSDGRVGRDDPPVQQAGRGFTAQRLHVFDEAGQLGQLLGDLRLCGEGPLAATDLDQAPPNQALDGGPNRRTADSEAFDQGIFRWKARARREITVSNLHRQKVFELGVKGQSGVDFELHDKIVMS
jgi:hypothetical protein